MGSPLELFELDNVCILCPECLEWVETTAAEGVPNQSLRACPECEHVFLVDIATVEYKVRLSCDKCEMLSINGVACHEIGCPNMGAKWEDGEWVKYVKCFECGCDVKKGESCDCQEPFEEDE